MISPGLHQHASGDDLIQARPAQRGLLPPAPPGPAPLRVIGDAVDWSIVIIGAVMIVLVFINVVMHAFGKDMAATTEMCELLMVWVTFLGGAAAARRGAHMAITELIDKLGTGPRRLMDLAISAVSAAVLASLVWYGWGITVAGWTNRLTVLDIPMSFQYLALPVASFITLLFVLWDGLQIMRGRSHQERFGCN
ncbi:MAG: TRAP transporter small permease subunit [Sulfuritalea sp.]|nr:TRAP transporter small permease subunit [Sulfuritalea sp.]